MYVVGVYIYVVLRGICVVDYGDACVVGVWYAECGGAGCVSLLGIVVDAIVCVSVDCVALDGWCDDWCYCCYWLCRRC